MYDIPEADTLWMESRWLGAVGNFDRTTDIVDLYGSHRSYWMFLRDSNDR